MTETRAVAKLPHVDIEILHREAPEEGAEYLSITLRGTPDLATAGRMLDPFRLLAATTPLNPFQLWLQLARPWLMWQPGGLWAGLLDERRG